MAEGFPRQLIAIFGAANESGYYTDFAIKAFRTYLCMMVLACVNKACFIFLQAVGKALTSTLLSMFREVVFGVGFALLLPVFFGLDGVLYSMYEKQSHYHQPRIWQRRTYHRQKGGGKAGYSVL